MATALTDCTCPVRGVRGVRGVGLHGALRTGRAADPSAVEGMAAVMRAGSVDCSRDITSPVIWKLM